MIKSVPKDKIKVVRIITRLNIGGPAIHAILLTEGLNSKLYEKHLIAGRPDKLEGDMSGLAAEKNLNVEYVPELGREIGIRDIVAFLKLFRYLRNVKPDIVHTHTAKAGALGRIAAYLTGVPLRVHTFHGHIFDGYFSPFKARVFLYIERFLGNFSDRVIAVSENVKNEIVNDLKVVKKGKCIVVPLGLELDKFLNNDSLKGRFRKAIGVDAETLLVGIVGRLVPIKNHTMFLDVARKIKDKAAHLKFKFLIIGDGEMRQSLEEYAKKIGIDRCVIFTGWVKDLCMAYADLDIITLTSLNEGTPVSLIEAMASGKPVVATDVGGVKDIVLDGENGFLVKSNNADDFSNKLFVLLQDKEKRSKFGMCGRMSVRERYSKNRLINDIEELYEGLIKEKGLNRRA